MGGCWRAAGARQTSPEIICWLGASLCICSLLQALEVPAELAHLVHLRSLCLEYAQLDAVPAAVQVRVGATPPG